MMINSCLHEYFSRYGAPFLFSSFSTRGCGSVPFFPMSKSSAICLPSKITKKKTLHSRDCSVAINFLSFASSFFRLINEAFCPSFIHSFVRSFLHSVVNVFRRYFLPSLHSSLIISFCFASFINSFVH